MATSKAQSVEEYLSELPDDRRAALAAVRKTVLKNLPEGYTETMQYGMISYVVPLETCPDTYNGQPLAIVSLASQKNHMSIYLMGVYGNSETERWFRERWTASGKKLDMGKSCLRFKKLDDLALDVVGEVVARVPVEQLIAFHERARQKR